MSDIIPTLRVPCYYIEIDAPLPRVNAAAAFIEEAAAHLLELQAMRSPGAYLAHHVCHIVARAIDPRTLRLMIEQSQSIDGRPLAAQTNAEYGAAVADQMRELEAMGYV